MQRAVAIANHVADFTDDRYTDRPNNFVAVSDGTFHEREISALHIRGYQLGRILAQGSFGVVRLSRYTPSSTGEAQLMACKIICKKKTPPNWLEKFFSRELDLIRNLSHPSIIKHHSVLVKDDTVFIFMRYAEKGDMLEYIRRFGYLAEPQARTWFRQAMSGMEYLHALFIAHRDLKCANLVITRHYNVKVADFGFARRCVDSHNSRVLSRTFCGSAAYAAPELFKGIAYDPLIADIWSLGVVLYVMFNGRMPFDDTNLKQLIEEQKQNKWKHRPYVDFVLSTPAKDLLKKLLEHDHTQRRSASTLLEHDWLRPTPKTNTTNPYAKYRATSENPPELVILEI